MVGSSRISSWSSFLPGAGPVSRSFDQLLIVLICKVDR